MTHLYSAVKPVQTLLVRAAGEPPFAPGDRLRRAARFRAH
jgi:hypothetical protein